MKTKTYDILLTLVVPEKDAEKIIAAELDKIDQNIVANEVWTEQKKDSLNKKPERGKFVVNVDFGEKNE